MDEIKKELTEEQLKEVSGGQNTGVIEGFEIYEDCDDTGEDTAPCPDVPEAIIIV